jgi:hypothetical protein
MAETSVTGPSTPISSVTQEPTQIGSRGDEARFDKDNKGRLDNFMTYLNQQVVMHERHVHEGRVFDVADHIGRNSVYLKPGETTPT